MSDNSRASDLPTDDEAPSMIKANFQRWLIVAGVLLTLMFIYMFMGMTKEQRIKEAENNPVVEVPKQVQEGSLMNTNPAIEQFQRRIEATDRSRVPVGEKQKTAVIRDDFAPRKTASFEATNNAAERRPVPQYGQKLNMKAETTKESPYVKHKESEQARAFNSIKSKDTIGDGSGFYGKSVEPQSPSFVPRSQASQPSPITREPIEMQQARIRSQIDALSEYRKAIERGEVDPSAPPPELMSMLEAGR